MKNKEQCISCRVVFWLVIWVWATYFIVDSSLQKSQISYDNGDLSSFAWTGFLPILIPLFIIQSGIYVVPSIVVSEIVLWIYRRYKK